MLACGMRITKNHALDWKHIALVALVVAALLGSYMLPDGARDELRTDLGYVWGALATLLGPLVRKRIAEATADDKGAP